MAKPRVAIFDFACCEGCQLQIVNLEEEMLDSARRRRRGRVARGDDRAERRVRHRHHRGLDHPPGGRGAAEADPQPGQDPDRAGGLCDDRRRSTSSRTTSTWTKSSAASTARTPACRTWRRRRPRPSMRSCKVDYKIHGCPIDRSGIQRISCAACCWGRSPMIPDYPVCVECKMQGNLLPVRSTTRSAWARLPAPAATRRALGGLLLLRLPRLRGQPECGRGQGCDGQVRADRRRSEEQDGALWTANRSRQAMSKTVDINVHHVTRVEGHGNIVVHANDGKIRKVEWQVPGSAAVLRGDGARRAATTISRPSSAASAASARSRTRWPRSRPSRTRWASRSPSRPTSSAS